MRTTMLRASALLLTFWPQLASAQRPLPADTARAADSLLVRLAPLQVFGSILQGATGPSARSGTPAMEISIGAAEIRALQPRFLSDALAGRPAATAYDDLGSPFKQTLVLRGFAASPVVGLPQGVAVLVDGIPMNEPGAGEVNFDLLPLHAVEQIEVLTGTASLLGPNALGGAVNLVTTRGGAERLHTVELSAGSYGARGVTASASGSLARIDYAVAAAHERERGWRDDMGGQRTQYFASASRLGSGRGVRLLSFGGRSHAQTAGSLPLSVYRVRPDSNLTAGDFELLRQLTIAAAGYTRLYSGTARARLYARVSDAERFNANQQLDPDVRSFMASSTTGLEVDWNVAGTLGSMTLDVRAGGGALFNRTSIALHAERIDAGLTTDVASPIRRLQTHAAAALHSGNASVSIGARFDAIRVPFRNRLRPARDTTSNFVQVSPRAGVSLRVAPATSLYASIGRSFRAPALIEIACADPHEPCPLPFALGDDPPIAPVRVTTYEAGMSLARRHITAQAAAYRSEVYDDIFLFPYEAESEPEGSTIDGFFGNVAHTRREGVNVSANVALRSHRAFASYAYTRATFRSAGIDIFSIREVAGGDNEVATGSRFPLVPQHTLSAGVDIRLPYHLAAGASLHHVGARYLRGDEANGEPPLPAYTTVEVRLGCAAAGWELHGAIRNATGADYLAFGTFNINQGAGGALERFVTPGSPRSFELTVQRSF